MQPLWAVENNSFAFTACNHNLEYKLQLTENLDLATFMAGELTG